MVTGQPFYFDRLWGLWLICVRQKYLLRYRTEKIMFCKSVNGKYQISENEKGNM
jgi:hypothetical protein